MKIGIAIVHFGEQSVLDNCLATLPVDCYSYNLEIKVFNCNENNVGFSCGNNILVKSYLNRNIVDQPDWIWLLNNDTTVPEKTLKAIQESLPLMPYDVGIVGFKILSMDNPDLIHHAGTGQCIPAGIHKSGSVKLGQYRVRTPEKWVTFASVFIRREVFETIGLLDGKMFNYYSDSDFCYRARYAGFKVIYEPTFEILHKIGSSAKPTPEQEKVIFSDSLVFQNKWINGKRFHDLDKELLQ